jgi:hypothetical protein
MGVESIRTGDGDLGQVGISYLCLETCAPVRLAATGFLPR